VYSKDGGFQFVPDKAFANSIGRVSEPSIDATRLAGNTHHDDATPSGGPGACIDLYQRAGNNVGAEPVGVVQLHEPAVWLVGPS
jgi:hypothetical protein